GIARTCSLETGRQGRCRAALRILALVGYRARAAGPATARNALGMGSRARNPWAALLRGATGALVLLVVRATLSANGYPPFSLSRLVASPGQPNGGFHGNSDRILSRPQGARGGSSRARRCGALGRYAATHDRG